MKRRYFKKQRRGFGAKRRVKSSGRRSYKKQTVKVNRGGIRL